MPAELIVRQVDEVMVEFEGPGRLLPWLGPAFRGVLARRLKDTVCRHPLPERRQKWEHCDGCPFASGCLYAWCYEPVHLSNERWRGQQDSPRALVVAPAFPAPRQADSGLRAPLRVTAIGGQAIQAWDDVLETLDRAGRAGLGADRVRFRLIDVPPHIEVRLAPENFPPTADAVPGVVPRLGVGLTAPLFLNTRSDGAARTAAGRKSSRRPVHAPSFVDLFRAALRTIGGFFATYAEPLPADFAALKQAAQRVRMVDHCFETFRQPKSSSRTGHRFEITGCVGGGVYANVPLALVPWMLWAGRLHVGTHRVAGAGSWRLVMD